MSLTPHSTLWLFHTVAWHARSQKYTDLHLLHLEGASILPHARQSPGILLYNQFTSFKFSTVAILLIIEPFNFSNACINELLKPFRQKQKSLRQGCFHRTQSVKACILRVDKVLNMPRTDGDEESLSIGAKVWFSNPFPQVIVYQLLDVIVHSITPIRPPFGHSNPL